MAKNESASVCSLIDVEDDMLSCGLGIYSFLFSEIIFDLLHNETAA